ncbi:outer membrane protein [Nonlabens sp.]|uniref:outer membrane protein n=1 Tax=Nonlabens sp. TaxID=1888209 RepID=UPI003F696789
MKKIFLTLLLTVITLTITNAQEVSKNAIGIRAGDGDGFGTEISYQRALSGNNRLEIDLGYENGDNFDGFKATGMYQWLWNIEGGFNWYAGAGAGVGTISLDDDFPARGNFNDDSETFIFAAGQVGIEYNFDLPLLISLDVRPEFYFGDFRDGNDLDIALGIRYQF